MWSVQYNACIVYCFKLLEIFTKKLSCNVENHTKIELHDSRVSLHRKTCVGLMIHVIKALQAAIRN